MDDITTIDDLPKNFSFASRAEYRRINSSAVLHAVFRASGDHPLRPTKAANGQSWEFALPQATLERLLECNKYPWNRQIILAESYLKTWESVQKSEEPWKRHTTMLKAAPK